MQFFPTLLSRVPTQTVVFGQWIHIAQICLLVSSERNLKFAATELVPSIRAIVVSYQGCEIYLVETYSDADVQHSIATAKDLRPQIYFLSLLPGSVINDLSIFIPSEIGWWSA